MLAIMVSALGHISGGHFNPAVTFGFLVTGRISGSMAGIYWIFQFAGAVFAALFLRAVWIRRRLRRRTSGRPPWPKASAPRGLPPRDRADLLPRLRRLRDGRGRAGAFRIVAGFAIGLMISVDVLVGGPLTGAAMNPQVAFGPQLVGDAWTSDAWIY